MNAKQFYLESKETAGSLAEFCKKARTSTDNFRQIALYNGPVSKALAERLADASGGKMTASEIMFPES